MKVRVDRLAGIFAGLRRNALQPNLSLNAPPLPGKTSMPLMPFRGGDPLATNYPVTLIIRTKYTQNGSFACITNQILEFIEQTDIVATINNHYPIKIDQRRFASVRN